MVEWFQIWEPVEHRARQCRIVGKQVVVTGDQPVMRIVRSCSSRILSRHPRPQRLVIPVRSTGRPVPYPVSPAPAPYSIGPSEERPALIELMQHRNPILAPISIWLIQSSSLCRCRTSRQHHPRLTPGQHPRDRAQIGDRRGRLARWAGRLPIFSEPISLTGWTARNNQRIPLCNGLIRIMTAERDRPVRRERGRRVRHLSQGLRRRKQGGLQSRRDEALQIAVGDPGVRHTWRQ